MDFPAGTPNPPGYFTIAIAAHNPSSHPVVTDLPLYSATGPSRRGFDYLISGSFGEAETGIVALDASSWTFSPGETKQQLFDFSVGPPDHAAGVYAPGSYTVRGAYGAHWSADTPFVLAP
jgi:hypothetical protein